MKTTTNTNKMKIKVGIKTEDKKLIPSYNHSTDSCFDLRSNETYTIIPGGQATVGTGIYLQIPEGYAIEVVPRSGLASKHGITVLNAPGQVDSDYTGEIKVIIANHGFHNFPVSKYDRIAQAKIVPVLQAEFEEIEELVATERNENGLGSSGIK